MSRPLLTPEEIRAQRAEFGARAQKDFEKYLLPLEEVVIGTRRHWASLAVPTLKSLPALFVGGWLLGVGQDVQIAAVVGALLLLGGLGFLGLHVAEWYMRHFIVSPRRMLLTSGVIVRTVTLLPRRRITDLTWQETFFGQILGYGTFRIESAGQHQALSRVTFLPHADVLYSKISALLFPDEVDSSDNGDGDGTGDEPEPPLRPRRPVPSPSGRRDTEPIPRPEP